MYEHIFKNIITLSRYYIDQISSKIIKLYDNDYIIYLPIFNCHSTVTKYFDFTKVIFYPIDNNYNINYNFLNKSIINNKNKNQIFYLVNYFGIKTDINYHKIVGLCKENNILFIQDNANSFWLKDASWYDLDSVSDISLYSFRKIFQLKVWASCLVNNKDFISIIDNTNTKSKIIKSAHNTKKMLDYILEIDLLSIKNGWYTDLWNIFDLNTIKRYKDILSINHSISKLIDKDIDKNYINFYRMYDRDNLRYSLNKSYIYLYNNISNSIFQKFIINDNLSFPMVFPLRFLKLRKHNQILLNKFREGLYNIWILTRWFWWVPKDILDLFTSQEGISSKDISNIYLLTHNYIYLTLPIEFNKIYLDKIISFFNNYETSDFNY